MLAAGNVEALIISFISVCAALIVYDIVCAVYFRYRASRIQKISGSNRAVGHYLKYPQKLNSEERLLAVEAWFDNMAVADPELYFKYRQFAAKAFSELICKGKRIDDIVMAYLVFLSTKYRVFYHTTDNCVKTELLFMSSCDDLYLRETVLHCIYSIGDEVLVYKAFTRLNNYVAHHHTQLLKEGLAEFTGDRKALADCLYSHFFDFKPEMQSVLASVFRSADSSGTSGSGTAEESISCLSEVAGK